MLVNSKMEFSPSKWDYAAQYKPVFHLVVVHATHNYRMKNKFTGKRYSRVVQKSRSPRLVRFESLLLRPCNIA